MSDTKYVYVERPRGNGCLWGCLAVLAICALPFLFAGGFGTWFLWNGFRESPLTRTAIELVRRDGLAQRVLGRPITIVGMEGNSFSFGTGEGARNTYILRLEGPRGAGTLSVTGHNDRGRARIDVLDLTGPDGRHYDLLHHVPVPAQGDGQDI